MYIYILSSPMYIVLCILIFKVLQLVVCEMFQHKDMDSGGNRHQQLLTMNINNSYTSMRQHLMYQKLPSSYEAICLTSLQTAVGSPGLDTAVGNPQCPTRAVASKTCLVPFREDKDFHSLVEPLASPPKLRPPLACPPREKTAPAAPRWRL